jgi:hypothetical protein
LNGQRWTKFPNPLSHYSRKNLHISSLHVQGIAWYVVYMVICGLSLESYDHTLRTICDFKLSIVTLDCLYVLLSQFGCKSYNERLSGTSCWIMHRSGGAQSCLQWLAIQKEPVDTVIGVATPSYSGHILIWMLVLSKGILLLSLQYVLLIHTLWPGQFLIPMASLL